MSFGVSYKTKKKLPISNSLCQSITCHQMRSPRKKTLWHLLNGNFPRWLQGKLFLGDVTPCNLVDTCRRFRRIGCQHHLTWCLFSTDIKLSLSHASKNTARMWKRQGCRGKILGLKKEEISGCSESRNGKLYGLYSSPRIIRIISSRRITWSVHMACI